MFGVGCLYWAFVCRLAAVSEPWDAPGYGYLWYPVSIMLAAIAGSLFGKRAWIAGAAVTASQVPVMMINGATGPLMAVGVLFLCVLARLRIRWGVA